MKSKPSFLRHLILYGFIYANASNANVFVVNNALAFDADIKEVKEVQPRNRRFCFVPIPILFGGILYTLFLEITHINDKKKLPLHEFSFVKATASIMQ